MSYYTNQRLKIYAKIKKKIEIKEANPHEMITLFGCIFVMCFNRLPSVNCYWSSKPSMGNALIKSAFSRDRFKLLFSKIYVNFPEKPDTANLITLMSFCVVYDQSDQIQRQKFDQTIDAGKACQKRNKNLDALRFANWLRL